MNRLSMTQRKWLLTAHIAFVVAHVGTLLSLLVMNLLAGGAGDPVWLKGAYLLIGKLDIVLVPATGVGMLATGLLLGALTHWGLFKSYWIIVKNAGSLVAFLTGVLISKPAVDKLAALANFDGTQALLRPDFLAARSQYVGALGLELVLLTPLLAVSVIKPWGVRRSTARAGAAANPS
jgi:hypothetical protein